MSHNTAVVGVGFGVYGHLEALSRHPEFNVVALVSPNRASSVARQRGIVNSFKSTAELLESIDVECVVIASPPHCHFDDVSRCLQAGKHVICEKPMTLSLTQATALKAQAERGGLVATVAHEFRFVPALVEMRRRLLNSCLGEIRRLEIVRHSSLLHDQRQQHTRGWWFRRESGGGIVGAQMAHLVDLSHWLARATPTRVAGLSRTAIPEFYDAAGVFESEIDDGAGAIIEYPRGVVATVFTDATLPLDEIRISVIGERGALVAAGESFEHLELTLRSDGAFGTVLCEPLRYARYGCVNGNVPLLMMFYDDVARALSGESHGLPTFADAVETQRVLSAVGYGQ